MDDIDIGESNTKEKSNREKQESSTVHEDEDSKSVHSHRSHISESLEQTEEIPPLTESGILRIINGLIHGDYDESIQLLWKTVESVQYDVEDSSVRLLVSFLHLVHLSPSCSCSFKVTQYKLRAWCMYFY